MLLSNRILTYAGASNSERTFVSITPHTETDQLLPTSLELSQAKRRLYEVALALFGDLGYHAVSLRDIAEALGQQPSAIYSHVGSKGELLFELALIGHRGHHAAIRDALMDAGREPVDQLRAVVGAHLDVHLDFPAMARLTNRELRALDPAQLDEVLAIRSQSEQFTIDVIDRGVRMGEFDVEDSFLAARAISAMAMRLPEWWRAETGPRTREKIHTAYIEYALRVVGWKP